MVMEKKIIGYKAPMNFLGTTDFVNKGDIFTQDPGGYFYSNHGTVKDKNKLPAAIVEQWEPVYEEPTPVVETKEFTARQMHAAMWKCIHLVNDLSENFTKEDLNDSINGYLSSISGKVNFPPEMPETTKEIILEGLKILYKGSYDLMETCEDRGWIEFQEPNTDGALEMNAAMGTAKNILDKNNINPFIEE